MDFRAKGYTYDTLLPVIKAGQTKEKLKFSESGDEHGFRLNVDKPGSYRIEADSDISVSLYGPDTWEPLPKTDSGAVFSLKEGEYFLVAQCRTQTGYGGFSISSEE